VHCCVDVLHVIVFVVGVAVVLHVVVYCSAVASIRLFGGCELRTCNRQGIWQEFCLVVRKKIFKVFGPSCFGQKSMISKKYLYRFCTGWFCPEMCVLQKKIFIDFGLQFCQKYVFSKK